jgi:hypothetical protein
VRRFIGGSKGKEIWALEIVENLIGIVALSHEWVVLPLKG